MTFQTKKQRLIERCREAEVDGFELVDKELKFGCEIHAKIFTYGAFCSKGERKSVFVISQILDRGAICLINETWHCFRDDIIKILGTPPSMQRVMAFLWRRAVKLHDKENDLYIQTGQRYKWFSERMIDIHIFFMQVSSEGTLNFFELIEKSNEGQFKEIKKFCEDFIF